MIDRKMVFLLLLSKSEKNYMEAIYVLTKRLGTVRSVDVANYLGHTRPSVTRAVANLIDKGYLGKIDHELVFTDSGRQTAEQIFERQCILTHILTGIGVNEKVASKDAQKMERVVSEQVVNLAAEAIHCQRELCQHCPRIPSLAGA